MATLDKDTVRELATLLDTAARTGTPVPKITDQYPDLDHDDAYAIQDVIKARALASGERIAGLKMGLTSLAKMKQMGVEAPIRGFMTDRGVVNEGDPIATNTLIHPRVEPELAFVTKAALTGPECTVEEVLAATDFIMPAIEILDSRYENFRFDLVSVIADNTSAAYFVTGSHIAAPDALDLRTLGVVVEKNGEVVQVGAGAAVLDNPALSVATLANMLSERGENIPAGTLILTGGITAAVAVSAGDVITVQFQHLGSLTIPFT